MSSVALLISAENVLLWTPVVCSCSKISILVFWSFAFKNVDLSQFQFVVATDEVWMSNLVSVFFHSLC